MIEQLLTFSLIGINILISLLFLKCFFPKDKFTYKDILLVCLLIVEGIIVSVSLHDVVILKLLLNLGTAVVIDIFVFKISWKKSLIFNLLYFAIFASLEIVVLLLFQLVFKARNYDSLTNTNGAAVMELICYLIMLLIIVLINIKHKRSIVTRLDVKGWIAFVMYPLTTLCVISFLLYIPQDQISSNVFYLIFAFAVCMLFLSIMQFFLFENIMQREADIYNKQALVEQAEHANKLYRSISEEREIQKARSHDYINYLNALLALAEGENRTKEISYLKEQIGIETVNFDIIDTGDAVINAVLNIKYREAKKKGIVMPLQIDDLRDLSISESDIVTILSNILDNAIKATESCDVKRIVLHITKQENGKVLCIDSSNTCLCDNFPGRSRYTTKDDKENHGYGISNIKYAVEKNNGECIIESREGIFRIIISIPL